MEEPARNLLCLVCGHEAHLQAGQEVEACPTCGDRLGTPADLDKTLTIRITEHELRVLTMWADNYARSINYQFVTRNILDRLATQTSISLSWSQEIADLRAALPEAEVKIFDKDGKEMEP